MYAVPASAFEITDDRGVVVRFERAPQRVVSLLPSLSETVCALGQCARLVGVDRYSNFPQALKKLPQLGGGLDPSIEAVVAQKPDVVLLAGSSRAAAQLEALGLKVLALEPKTHAEMRSAIEKIGRLLQTPDAPSGAHLLLRQIDAAIEVQARALPQAAKRARVFVAVSNAPHGAGAASFIGETLQRLGVQNIVPAAMGVFPKLNPEFVVRADPDVIIASVQNAQGMAQRPGWSRIRAIREKRVCRLSADQADVLVRPGPRMGEAAQLIADCLKLNAPKENTSGARTP
jgi:iron complex transport system substrate-binding protein